ncbi:MAG: 2-C-methyl-D-erythritol 4-phosphate cytidylyltransferase [Prevotella sp.]|nr:2-C-methyl-D-erythritol 4-phosphate cytidylyltransferase [Prevotella sp.]
MRNVAVILAGGKGSRMATDVPKQFIVVGGKTIIEHTIRAFDRHAEIDEIAVVAAEEYLPRIREIAERGEYNKVRRFLVGGGERYLSSLAAVRAYCGEECNLLIHDGARPNVSQDIITKCTAALRMSVAVEVAVPVTDTIVELSPDGTIAHIPPRRMLRRAQTPQCFRRSVIALAFKRALANLDFNPTDDISVVSEYMPEVNIRVVEGDRNNIKITYQSDIQLFERLITD